ncbi:MAG: sigma-70 family RNA polymerase sigma factor [Crocinitomicaceae bacterium]|nr:sigma-70 family RNA polymerase sigma factor [Crocinitomicaceae bacterium]MBP6032526.1 sigma-70 family RNA polymerase sigma factor [Crocinitomicaceae bacterium]
MTYYDPVHARFERFCKARVYGEMDFKDLMHDTLVVAYEKFNKVQHADAFLYYLFGIAIRLLSNARKKKRALLTKDGNLVANELIVYNLSEQQFEHEVLYAALAQLPEIQKESLVLYELSGFSVKEIAQIHGCTEDAVKQRLSRGRLALIQLLSLTETEQIDVAYDKR